MANTKILLADDHKIIRDGIKNMLEDLVGFEIAAEAENGQQAVDLCESELIDLVIMDITMPKMNGIEATQLIRENHPDIKILALTMMKDDEHIRDMIRAGASGYILKSSGQDELIEAINIILEDKHYFSDETTHSIMMDLVKNKGQRTHTNSHEDLTDRELEVLTLICDEYTNQEIAAKLFISVRTVDAHRRNLLQKTGAKNTAGLVRYAVKNNLLL